MITLNLTKKEAAWLKRHLKDQQAFFYEWSKGMDNVRYGYNEKEVTRAKAEGKVCDAILRKL